MWFVYHEDPLPLWNLAVVVAVVAVMILGAMRYWHFAKRTEGEDWRRTCLTYSIPPLLVLLLFPANAEYAAVVFTVLTFGDSAAAICGQLFGARRLPWNEGKSWVGLAAFVLAAAPVATVAFWGEARNPEVPWRVALICGIVPAVVAGLCESVKSRLDDNIRICLAAAVTVVVADRVLVPWLVA